MPVTVNVNGLSVVHQGSEGVSRATLPNVCTTPTTGAQVPYGNVAYSRDLRDGTASLKVDGYSAAHDASVFARSFGDEEGRLGGVVSGTHGGRASWLSSSFDVRFEGRGVCRLTDKMLHNDGNTVSCAGLLQRPVARSSGAQASKSSSATPTAHAAKKKKVKPAPMEIALPFFASCLGPDDPATGAATMRQDVVDRAHELGVTYFRMFMPYSIVSRQYLSIAHVRPNPPKLGSVVEPFADFDRFVGAVVAAGFGVEITVHGGASPWTCGQGMDGGGVVPSPTKFARYFSKVVQRYKARGAGRFSVWNEPNHPGFLRAGAYWKTKHAKKRVKRMRELKALQTVFDRALDPAALAAAVAKAKALGHEPALKKLPNKKNGLPAYPPANGADGSAVCNALADVVFGAKLGKHSEYRMFDIEENAKLYRAIFDACWKRAKGKGAKIWLGELSSGSAFPFIRDICNPKVTGTKKVLKADALAMHPYQYLVPPNKKPDARPIFPPKMKVPKEIQGDAANALARAYAKAFNKQRAEQMARKWPTDPKKRRAVRKDARENTGIGALGAVQALLKRLHKQKRITSRNGKQLDLYLTEFGYHRFRPQKLQLDRQVPEARRAKWVKLAFDAAYRHGAKQNLYYHLLPSWEQHAWDSSLLDYDLSPLPTFTALQAWVAKAKQSNKVKLAP